jgi:hypothetical protein
MNTTSNRIEALLRLDPGELASDPDGRNLDHPAERYRREQWATSNVVPFAASLHLPNLARLATEIVSGRRPGGVESAVMRRARDLHLLRVPMGAARREIADYAFALEALVDAARERGDGE